MHRTITILLLSLLITACGQKGDLQLPDAGEDDNALNGTPVPAAAAQAEAV